MVIDRHIVIQSTFAIAKEHGTKVIFAVVPGAGLALLQSIVI